MKKHLTFIYTLLVALFGCNSNDSMPMEPQASNGKPVYLGGCTSWSLEGHAWVLDGYLLRRENGTERETIILTGDGMGLAMVTIFAGRSTRLADVSRIQILIEY